MMMMLLLLLLMMMVVVMMMVMMMMMMVMMMMTMQKLLMTLTSLQTPSLIFSSNRMISWLYEQLHVYCIVFFSYFCSGKRATSTGGSKKSMMTMMTMMTMMKMNSAQPSAHLSRPANIA